MSEPEYIKLLEKFKTSDDYKNFLVKNFDLRKLKNVYIYGTKTIGKILEEKLYLAGIEVEGFIDNCINEEKSSAQNKQVFCIENLRQKKDDITIIVASTTSCHLIINELKKSGFKKIVPYFVVLPIIMDLNNYKFTTPLSLTEKVHIDLLKFNEFNKNKDKYISLKNYFNDKKSLKVLDNHIKYRITLDGNYLLEIADPGFNHYFDEDIIKFEENEVFADGGAYHGIYSGKFINKTNESYKKILLFEPDTNNFKKAKKNLENRKNIDFYNIGLFSHKTSMNFKKGEEGESKISDSPEDSEIVEFIDLNEFKDDITFIKMDIEGAEKEALKGASKHLQKGAKLAISVYHKIEDLYEIPRIIKEINPDYKLYLRHYGQSFVETLVYAVI